MTQQTINVGTTANDGTGDPLRTAYTKANSNFTELYQRPATATTWTATQTFNGSSSTPATLILNALEPNTISATAATGTLTYYAASGSLYYLTANATANWIVNLTMSAATTLNTAMTAGQTLTLSIWVTQGATAFYNNAVQVDGSATGVTTKWIGGAPTAGNASGIDVYTYSITKTANAAFTVLASVSQYK